jgi:hypothetical protein
VPFVGIGELSYGLSDAFALGAMVGVTPITLGVGARPRVRVDLDAQHRLSLVVPALYYPTHPNPRVSPWVLVRPVALFERVNPSGARFGFGPGLIVTAPTKALWPNLDESAALDSHYAGLAAPDETPSGLWQTLVLTGALPVTDSSTTFAEAGLVFDGPRLVGDDWVGGPPIVVVLGIARQL